MDASSLWINVVPNDQIHVIAGKLHHVIRKNYVQAAERTTCRTAPLLTLFMKCVSISTPYCHTLSQQLYIDYMLREKLSPNPASAFNI